MQRHSLLVAMYFEVVVFVQALRWWRKRCTPFATEKLAESNLFAVLSNANYTTALVTLGLCIS